MQPPAVAVPELRENDALDESVSGGQPFALLLAPAVHCQDVAPVHPAAIVDDTPSKGFDGVAVGLHVSTFADGVQVRALLEKLHEPPAHAPLIVMFCAAAGTVPSSTMAATEPASALANVRNIPACLIPDSCENVGAAIDALAAVFKQRQNMALRGNASTSVEDFT